MKEKLILEISNAMADILSVEQIAKLNGVLLKTISKYTITEGESDAPPLESSNETLLKLFISAKQVEGCSQPTIPNSLLIPCPSDSPTSQRRM